MSADGGSRLIAAFRRRSFLLGIILVAFVPVALIVIPLQGSLEALNRTSDIAVGIVSLDEPQDTGASEAVDLGRSLSNALATRSDFSWKTVPADDARTGLADGRFTAVVTIDAGFTSAVLDSGAALAAGFVGIQSSADQPEIAQRVREAVAETYALTVPSASDSSSGGTASGTAGALASLSASAARARQDLDALASSAAELSAAVSALGGNPGSSQRKLTSAVQAAHNAQDAASAADSRVASVATSASSVAGAVASTRNLLVAEMKVQGLSSTQRSHILAVYDRLNPSISSLQSAVASARSAAKSADSAASDALRAVRAIDVSGSPAKARQTAQDALDSVAASTQDAVAAMQDAEEAITGLSTVLAGTGTGQTAGLELTPARIGPTDSLHASSLITSAMLALGIGAALVAVLITRIGRPLAISGRTGIPVLPHAGPTAAIGAAQGALLAGALALGLRPSAAGIAILFLSCAAIAIAFATASHAAILWAGMPGLALVLAFAGLEWSLLSVTAPAATLPTGLRVLDSLTPGGYGADALRYGAFGEPFTGASHLAPPAIVFLALVGLSMVAIEMALNSRRSWAAKRLAEAI